MRSSKKMPQRRPIRRLLIANRGEIAVRIARSCRQLGVEVVAIYSDADRHALPVTTADCAVRVGPAPAVESYLNVSAIVDAARSTGCDAVHPGYGFLAERPEFADAVARSGMTFVGPSAEVMALLGDKAAAKRLARERGVPTVSGSDEVLSDDAICRLAQKMGFPVVLKAAAGGGGRGMRVVQAEVALPDAITAARAEARRAFGDDRLLIERWIEHGRHVEAQAIGLPDGSIVTLGIRDCSIQRRHQKIVEETPAPALEPHQEALISQHAATLLAHAGYESAGTVEFLYDQRAREAYFLEVNTRLQVEHPVTEAVYGVDLVAWQLLVAAGQPLPPGPVRPNGHAFEARLYAEDPITMYPATGRLDFFQLPSGPSVRVDAGVCQGDDVTAYYDPLLAKIITHAEGRVEALERMRSALRQCSVLGVTTNLPLLMAICDRPELASADLSTRFLSDHEDDIRSAVLAPPSKTDWERLLGAWAGEQAPMRDPWTRFGPWWLDGMHTELLQVLDPAGRLLDERAMTVPAPSSLPGSPAATVRRDDGSVDVSLGGRAYRIKRPPVSRVRSIQAVAGSVGPVVAPMPGVVLAVHVAEGDVVIANQALATLEAMKMHHVIAAPERATVVESCCRPGQLVSGGAVLFELGPAQEAESGR